MEDIRPEQNKRDIALIYHNMGLGDHIVCNGLIRCLYERHRVMGILCKGHNAESVRAMFCDLPGITIIPIHDDREASAFFSEWYGERYAIGVANPMWNPLCGKPFDVVFYEQASIPHTYRWDKFKIGDITRVPIISSEPYIFLHDDPLRGFTIDKSKIKNMPIIFPDPKITPRITDWSDVLGSATEIHCINSSFLLLADSIPTTGKLYWHRYARDQGILCNPTVRKDWTVFT